MTGDFNWIIILIGIATTLFVLIDVYLTVLHIDRDGPMAWFLFRGVWFCCIGLVRFFPGSRRSILSLTGPTMIVVIFTGWILLYILGFALIYWPNLNMFRAEDEFAVLGFMDALYYSGITASVLGYGDITPLQGTMQFVAFFQSALGFALLTGIITYLINVVSSVGDRNALSLRLWTESGKTADGTSAAIRFLTNENIDDIHRRLRSLIDVILKIYQKMHQFPILDLFYRSKNRNNSPEFIIKILSELCITLQMVSSESGYRRLQPSVDELNRLIYDLMILISAKHFRKEIRYKVHNCVYESEDEFRFEEIGSSLRGLFSNLEIEKSGKERILIMLCQSRLFLNELDKLTGWRVDENSDRTG